MSTNFREVLKKIGITQQELADYLGISRQYLNNYLDETLEEPKIPQKYFDNILFLFECKTRDEIYDDAFIRNAKTIKKRMGIVKSTKESIDNLFNIEHEKKMELFKIVEYFQNLIKLDQDLLESFAIFMENITKEESYRSLLSYIGKKYVLIQFDDPRFNSDIDKCREALLNEVFDEPNLNFEEYKDKYEKFVNSTKKQNEIDLGALKKSLSELGYTNISQKEVVDLLKKYNEIKNTDKEKE
ncbi:helix-turn-helix transcriptional regulator [Mycoplasmatota bacterium]|nr:helix-turn-helix transcriptional regulator [Mycoplasmatota bacterium]